MGQLDVLSDFNTPLTRIILGRDIDNSRRVKRQAETILWEHGMQIIEEMIFKDLSHSFEDLSLDCQVDDQKRKEETIAPE